MKKIENIEYNNEYIKIESADNYIYKIPNNNSYVRNLLYKGISVSQEMKQTINFCNKCSNICLLPIWVALGFVAYGVMTNFIALDLLLILCGGMTTIALTGRMVFKSVEKKLKKKAKNNEYFTKLYEYAINGGKINNKKQNKMKQNNKQANYSKTTAIIKNNNQINNSSYNLTRNNIVQDEEVHQRKR